MRGLLILALIYWVVYNIPPNKSARKETSKFISKEFRKHLNE